jgi:3-phenylpropionate/cinnamic acid dioxygenase small subunit
MSNDATTLAAIVDRLEIQDLLVRYCKAIDQKDWDLLDTVFVPDAHVDYTSSGGAVGPYPEVRAWLAQVLPHFPMSQHAVSNFEIVVRGDRATSRAYFYNPMARPQPDGGVKLFFIGGYYVDDLVRTPSGWRITKRVEQQAWADIRP